MALNTGITKELRYLPSGTKLIYLSRSHMDTLISRSKKPNKGPYFHVILQDAL